MVTQSQSKPKGIITRKKLLIISTKEPIPIGERGAKKLEFKASDETGQSLNYFTFRESLFNFIQKDATLDCEIETSERPYQGEVYIDKKINQIFINGDPVAQKKNYGSRGRSPEEIASIELQTAMKMINEQSIAGLIGKDHILYIRLIRWLDLKTAPVGPDPLAGVLIKPVEKPTAAPPVTQADQSFEKLGRTEEEKHLANRRHFANKGQFMTAATNELGLTTAEIKTIIKVNDVSEITDLEGAWNKLKAYQKT